MKRVMIMGSPGAGKSTLARKLAAVTGLPLKHLDAEYWLPGWTEREPAEWDKRLAKIVAGERWIIDGNYGSSLEPGAARADTIVHLDYPTALCIWRACKRIAITYGRVRADSAPDCPEQFDPLFLSYIARFRGRKRAKIVKLIEGFTGAAISFTRPAQAERWLVSLAAEAR